MYPAGAGTGASKPVEEGISLSNCSDIIPSILPKMQYRVSASTLIYAPIRSQDSFATQAENITNITRYGVMLRLLTVGGGKSEWETEKSEKHGRLTRIQMYYYNDRL